MRCKEQKELVRHLGQNQTLLSVRASTKSSTNSVKAIIGHQLCVHTTVVPAGGQANKCIINLLSDFLSIPKSKIDIYSGVKNRNKVFLINAVITEDLVIQKLCEVSK